MSCLGVLFALPEREVAILRSLGEWQRVEHVREVIEERELGGEWAIETDKAWDAIHRCFAAGRLEWTGGEDPLNHIILGGEILYSGDDYILSLKNPNKVREIAASIANVTYDDLRSRYENIDPAEYGVPLSDDDWQYTWENFNPLVEFYQRAAKYGRYALFTADQ